MDEQTLKKLSSRIDLLDSKFNNYLLLVKPDDDLLTLKEDIKLLKNKLKLINYRTVNYREEYELIKKEFEAFNQ